MPISETVGSTIYDWQFEPTKNPNQFWFFLHHPIHADVRIGCVSKLRSGWACSYIATGPIFDYPVELRSADGFKSRWKACEHLLRLWRHHQHPGIPRSITNP